MKKVISAFVCVALLVSFSGCSASSPASPSSASKTEKFVSAEPGFIVPDYEQFNSPNEENGLAKTKIAFTGILKEQGEKDGAYYFIVSTPDGDWLVLVGSNEIKNLNVTDVIGLIKKGSEVDIYAEYGGFSSSFNLPACYIITDGFFFRVSGSDEKNNPAWKAIQLETVFDSLTSKKETETETETDMKAKPSVSQEQAIRKANEYLSFSAFSKSGLVGQLEFEGFSTEDAEFAVENIVVDWNEQAAKKAKSYLDISSFSRKSLIEQLEFEGFTAAEAEYGANSVGL